MIKTNVSAGEKYNADNYPSKGVYLNTDEFGNEECCISDGLAVLSLVGDYKDVLMQYVDSIKEEVLKVEHKGLQQQAELSTISDSGMVSESFVLELIKAINK